MNKNNLIKFTLMPAFIMSLVACGNKEPTVTDMKVSLSAEAYNVGYKIDTADFKVQVTLSDKTEKDIKEGFTVEPTVPYTFIDDDTTNGKDFKVSYKGKEVTVHASVVSADGKAQITFKNYDGTILQNERVAKGEEIEYHGELPRKAAKEGVVENVFMGWDKEIGTCTQNTVFTAQYKQIDNYIDEDHDGLPFGVDNNDQDNHFDVKAKSFVTIDQNINIDFTKFLEPEANTKYDNDLAKLGLFMSNPKIDFKDGLFTSKNCGGRENALYARLGCDDFHHFDFKDEAANTYKYDPRDTTSGVYGHKYLRDKDNKVVKDLIFIAFEGTNGKNRWASNFDVGYDDGKAENYNTDYYSKAKRTDLGETGTRADHPEWDDKDFHKGFYIAAHRVLNDKVDGGTKEGPVKFIKYIADHTTEGLGDPIVFVTGHSRGGAMANIVGEYLQNKYNAATGKNCTPFTYAFAAPSVWGSKKEIQCNTVFNILNNDDLVTKVPFSGWDFTKLGNTVIDESAGKYKTLYDEGNDRKYQWIPGATTEAIFSNLGVKGRDNIYKFDEKLFTSTVALNEESFTSEGDANDEITKLRNEYAGKLGNFFNFVDLKAVKRTFLTTDYWDIYPVTCLGTVTALVGCVMTNDEKVLGNLDYVLPLISNSNLLAMVADLAFQILPEGPDKIALPHDYGAYHIILREYKAPANK